MKCGFPEAIAGQQMHTGQSYVGCRHVQSSVKMVAVQLWAERRVAEFVRHYYLQIDVDPVR